MKKKENDAVNGNFKEGFHCPERIGWEKS